MRIVKSGEWAKIASSTATYLRSEIVSWLQETKEVSCLFVCFCLPHARVSLLTICLRVFRVADKHPPISAGQPALEKVVLDYGAATVRKMRDLAAGGRRNESRRVKHVIDKMLFNYRNIGERRVKGRSPNLMLMKMEIIITYYSMKRRQSMMRSFLPYRSDPSGLSQCFDIAHRAGSHGHSLLLLQEQIRRRRTGVDLGSEGPGAAIQGRLVCILISNNLKCYCLTALFSCI